MDLFPIGRIISGGQTGVDRAALDFALGREIPCGGWCPAGRRAEGGPIPECYPLRETETGVYPQRTRQNVRDADATLIVTRGPPGGGTALTVRVAVALGRPHLILDLGRLRLGRAAALLRQWLWQVAPVTLNVAGPRATEAPILGKRVCLLLGRSLTGSTGAPPPWPPRRPRQPSLFDGGENL
ncbi:MAG: molybdenum cofactor carrier [Candidatus Riflebacteria bacterium]|nr:molybdenum cofactor carrier [Candidatus Riflebacteria bacterium]